MAYLLSEQFPCDGALIRRSDLVNDLKPILPPVFGLRVGRTFVVVEANERIPSAGVAAVVSAHVSETVSVKLLEAKNRVVDRIDSRTRALISNGFPFDDGNGVKIYSLSLAAQSRMEGAHQLKDIPGFFPLQWPTDDSTYVMTITDAIQFDAFHLAAALQLRSIIQSAYPIRAAVFAANTIEELAAVQDTR